MACTGLVDREGGFRGFRLTDATMGLVGAFPGIGTLGKLDSGVGGGGSNFLPASSREANECVHSYNHPMTTDQLSHFRALSAFFQSAGKKHLYS
jgi:hypothetical protein